jgi:hypothetical protein
VQTSHRSVTRLPSLSRNFDLRPFELRSADRAFSGHACEVRETLVIIGHRVSVDCLKVPRIGSSFPYRPAVDYLIHLSALATGNPRISEGAARPCVGLASPTRSTYVCLPR